MIYTFAEVVIGAFEAFLVHIFLNSFFTLRYGKKPLVSYLIFAVILSAVSLLLTSPILRICTFTILLVCFTFWKYKCTFLQAVYATLLFSALAAITDFVNAGILYVFDLSNCDILINGNSRLIFITLSKVTHLGVILLVSSWGKRGLFNLPFYKVFPLAMCQVFSIFMCCYLLQVTSLQGVNKSIPLIVALIGLLYINVIWYVYMLISKSGYDAELRNKLAAQKLAHYKDLLADQEQTRALWHDISKHINTISALVFQNQDVQAIQGLSELQDLFAQTGKIVDIGNPTLNAILNDGIRKAEQLNIKVELDAFVAGKMDISPLLMSTIINNTFDNSLRACENLSECDRIIHVSLRQKGDLLSYQISNQYNSESRTNQRLGVHGYGLNNVRRRVEENGGELTISDQGDIFIVSVILNV